jgi:CHAT domain-containing protein
MLLINPIARLLGRISGKNSIKIVNEYLEEIENLRSRFEYANAIKLCDEAMGLLGEKYSKTDITVLMIQIQQVVIHALLAQYTKSEEKMVLFEKSLEEAEFVSNNVAIEFRLGKALLAEHRNQLQLAEENYCEVIDYLKESSNELSDTFYKSNLSLAEIHLGMGEAHKALQDIDGAKYFTDRIDPDDQEFMAEALSPILYTEAKAFMQLGDFEKSKELFMQSIKLLEKFDLIDLDYADVLVDYSHLLLKIGKIEKVESFIKKAKALFKKAGLINHEIPYLEAIRLYKNGELEKSLITLLDIYDNIFPRLHLEYRERLELEIISMISTLYCSLDDFTNSVKFLNILNKELFNTINESAKKLTDYERYYFLNSVYTVLLNIYELNYSYQSQPLKFRKELYSFRLLMKSIDEYCDLNKIPDYKLVTKQLSKDSVIVDIIRIEMSKLNSKEIKYFAFLIDKDIRIVQLENDDKLETNFHEQYLKTIKRKAVDIVSYKNYWSQLAILIADKSDIYIISEGIYNFINIDNLLTPENKYLFENKNIHLFHNYFINRKAEKNVNNEAIVIGNPKFELSKSLNQLNPPDHLPQRLDSEILSLPFSEEEGKSISNILIKSEYKTNEYYGEDANLEKINSIDNPKLLHIATHGFNFQNTNSVGGITEWEHLSGLLLADSVYKKDEHKYYNYNGMLFSKNIKDLKLSNTKLGVMSACSSGAGMILNTGGIIGIQKAMFIAGVNCLLVSLWEIEDKVTKEFMSAFYSEWVKREDNDISFTVAKVYIKEKYIHPFYWAGFRLIHNSILTDLGAKNA